MSLGHQSCTENASDLLNDRIGGNFYHSISGKESQFASFHCSFIFLKFYILVGVMTLGLSRVVCQNGPILSILFIFGSFSTL
jgi:hypothetical protein